MVEWIDPVYDRTVEDVEFAKAQIAEWIKSIQTGDTVSTYDLKGCLNLSDINRIEGNIKFLAEKLSALGYPPDVTVKSWKRSGVPNEEDIKRIINNTKSIVRAYYQQKGVSELPHGMTGWDEINAIEENLAKIKELYDAMVKSFRLSGTFTSGSSQILPIRR
jgi:hypothetical protein